MIYNLHTGGNRNASTLIDSFPTYESALEAWSLSQGGERPGWSIVPMGERDELDALGNLDSIVPGYPLGGTSKGVYCVRAGDTGVTTLGFSYANRKGVQVALWLAKEGAPFPACVVAESGSPAAYLYYVAAMAAGSSYHHASGRRCPVDLTPALTGLEGCRVEVTDSEGEKRRFRVGKSTGWCPVHLELEGRKGYGGSAYLEEGATVRVIDYPRAGR